MGRSESGFAVPCGMDSFKVYGFNGIFSYSPILAS